MTIATGANLTPASSAEYLFNLYQTLLAAGFIRKGSSDATSFDNTGVADNWSTIAKVNHAGAWVRLTDPANGAEYTLQFNGTTGIRRKYSAAAKFTGGSPGATQTPSATDEGIATGGGTDAAPTYGTVFPGVVGHQQIYVDGTNAPYPFYSIGYPNAGGAPNHQIVSDAVDNKEPGDSDALVHLDLSTNACVAVDGAGNTTALSDLTFGPKGWLYLDVPASKGFVCCPMVVMCAGNGGSPPAGLIPGNALLALATSPRTGKDPTLPITYMRDNTETPPTGYKGTSRLFRWVCVVRATPQGGTATVAGDREIAGQLACIWDPAAGAWI